MSDWATIVIPTRDSEAWIGTLVRFYRARDFRPVVLVDTRGTDATARVARAAGARVWDVTPFAWTEQMVRVTPTVIETPWALFIHDDEAPSDALLARLRGEPPPATVQSVAIPRRWAWHEPGRPLTYGTSRFWHDRANVPGANHGWRLFRPDAVTYTPAMHSEGFFIEDWARVPATEYYVHFEWVLRSRAQRREKIRRYDRIRYGYGLFVRNVYLPEEQPDGHVTYAPFETDAFDELARVYHAARGHDPVARPDTLSERYVRIKHRWRDKLIKPDLSKTPKDRQGLAPRMEREQPWPPLLPLPLAGEGRGEGCSGKEAPRQ